MARKREEKTPRKMKSVFLVFCEGETEENYIDFIKKRYKSPIKIVPKTEGQRISSHLITKRQQELKISRTDKITTFLMYDLDVKEVTQRLKKIDAIWLCSNPCIELWFLLHEQDQTAEVSSSESIELLRKSGKAWLSYSKPSLTEAQKESLWENRYNAINRAKVLSEDMNPSSRVYVLLEKIEAFVK